MRNLKSGNKTKIKTHKKNLQKLKYKMIKNLIKNHTYFYNDFETCFIDFGTILAPKTSPK